MRYKIQIKSLLSPYGSSSKGQEKEQVFLESSWPKSSEERYLVAPNSTPNSPEAPQPRTYVQVHRHLGVVVLAEEKSQGDQKSSLSLERNVRLRQLTVRWDPDVLVEEVTAELVTKKSGVLKAEVGFDLPSQGVGAGAQDKNKKLVIRSQMTGKVLQVLAATGDLVSPENPVLVIEAMKMENRVFAPRSGKVLSVSVKVGDLVQLGKELMAIE